jgi:hypothetical protein
LPSISLTILWFGTLFKTILDRYLTK